MNHILDRAIDRKETQTHTSKIQKSAVSLNSIWLRIIVGQRRLLRELVSIDVKVINLAGIFLSHFCKSKVDLLDVCKTTAKDRICPLTNATVTSANHHVELILT